MTHCIRKTETLIFFEDCAVFLVMTEFRTKTEIIISFERLCGLPSYDTL